MKKIKFSFLTGDINWLNGGKWISQELCADSGLPANRGNFNYFFIISLENMDDLCGKDNEGQPKYSISLQIVSPDLVGENVFKDAAISCGVEDIGNTPPIIKAQILSTYGVYSIVFSARGNNAHKLIEEAKKQANSFVFSSLENPVNKIGTTGWEAMVGDFESGIQRTIESGSTAGNILKKVYNK